MQKLKAVFRSSSRKRAQQSTDTDQHHSEASSPSSVRNDRRATSLDERRPRQSTEHAKAGSQQHGRSRPLSSVYDSRNLSTTSRTQPASVDFAQSQHSQEINGSIANDYKAYLPALSPVHDAQDEQYTLGGDRRLIDGGELGNPHENVADRNIDRYRNSIEGSKRKPLPATPGMYIDQSTVLHEAVTAIFKKNHVNGFTVLGVPGSQGIDRKQSVDSGISPVPSAGTGESSVGKGETTRGGLVDSILPHTEATTHEKNQWKNSNWPLKVARAEPQVSWSKRRPQASQSDEDEPLSPADPFVDGQHLPSRSKDKPQHSRIPVDGHADIEAEIEQLLDGVVDLRNTVDEDKDVQWAPAVTHEVVKPHEHEIIQHQIFREIHNYEYYHRIQPVYDLEVLPPRHWIPNPAGQGLIEISADELPTRTGNNRRWKIIHEHVELPTESRPRWRTEPEVIEHPTTITAEGFERKETTIIYPPTLQDMSEYDGLVQPVHFDHKTGKRWLGEITTMHKLRHELGQVSDPDLSLRELGASLPDVPDVSEVPDLSQSPSLKRKPVTGPVPAQVRA